MKRSIATCLILATCSGIAACTPAEQTFQPRLLGSQAIDGGEALLKGQSYFRRGEYALAIESFRRQVRFAPDAADGYNGIAACYDMMGRFDLSEKFYQMALARSPTDGRIYRNMARSLDMQGRKGEGQALLAEWDAIQSGKMVVAMVPEAAVAEPTATTAIASALPVVAVAPADLSNLPALPPSPSSSDMATSVPSVASPMVEPQKAVAAVRGTEIAAQPAMPAAAPVSLERPRPAAERSHAPLMLASAANPTSGLPIRLMNAAGQRGLAKRVQQHLAQSGIGQTQVGDADRRYRLSWVVYPVGQKDRALSVQKSLPFRARIVPEPRASRIVVLLGANAGVVQTASLSKPRRG